MLTEILERAELDMTGLAALGPVHRSQVSRWLKSKSRPDHDTLRLIRDGIRRSHPELDYLAGELWVSAGYGEQPSMPDMVIANWDDDGVRQIWQLTTMPEETRLGLIRHYLAVRSGRDRDESAGHPVPGPGAGPADREAG